MKKIYVYIATAMLVAGGFSSCNLDKEVDLTFTADNVFADEDMTRGVLANCYTYLPDAFYGFTQEDALGAFKDCMTDNATPYWNGLRYRSVLQDTYDATGHSFAEYYLERDIKGIRVCNQFMENARPDVIGNSEKPGDDNKLYERSVAEARFIRAMLHFDLVGWFGAIPVEDHVLTQQEAAEIARTPAAEALQWIANECDSVKDVLPFRYSNEAENWGRINGAAAYALKSRALLYLASPLNNPSKSTDLWQKAADAAIAFINKNKTSSNPYKLYTTSDNNPKQNYYQCFVSTPHLNPEYILSRSEWNTSYIERLSLPCGYTGKQTAVGRTNPTQNLVDAYETINGLPIEEDPTFDANNPYENRDPRLEQTILHQGSIWGDPSDDSRRAVNVTYGTGEDYQALHGGTTTGYYTKKFCYEISFKKNASEVNNPHACPIFRYAEMLLNAAEALNEAGKTNEAYQYVNEVRARVGMPAYSGMTQDKLRERIQNERRIELCFEDHRFFDERRWKLFEGKTASSEKNLPRYKQVYNLYGIRWNSETEFQYVQEEKIGTRAFASPKNYYFPIPDATLKKNPNLGQNPGWELTSNDSGNTGGGTESAE